MSDLRYKTYIFIDRVTGVVLRVKNSRDLSYDFSGKEFRFLEVRDSEPVLCPAGWHVYSVVNGFRAFTPEKSEVPRLELLKSKIELLLAYYMQCEFFSITVRDSLNVAFVSRSAIEPLDAGIINSFMLQEIGILEERRRVFFQTVCERVERCGDLLHLETEMSRIKHNFRLGYRVLGALS